VPGNVLSRVKTLKQPIPIVLHKQILPQMNIFSEWKKKYGNVDIQEIS
jgi:hypothetical protein